MNSTNIMDKLGDKATKISPICVGLDSVYSYLPDFIKNKDMSMEDKIYEYNKQIVDASYQDVACYKIQIACYEALGLCGMKAFAKTLRYVRSKGCIAISDVKRGDISSTAKQYAQGHFTGDFETDIITINAYMGEDAISPYYEYLGAKGMFILVKTSNPSGIDFQDQMIGDLTVYEQTAKKVAEWGQKFVGDKYSAIGAVTGCTYAEQFHRISKLMPNTFYLIPGYGAQGGTGKDIASFFEQGICGVVNSSRGIITAHKGKTEGEDFVKYIRQAVLDMKKDIQQWL